VSGGTALSLTTGTPAPVVDVTAPFTTVDGGGNGWRRTPAKLVLTAGDAGSGVDFIEAAIDGAGLAKLPGLPGILDVSGQGVHTVLYRATDKDGNAELTRRLTIRIDAEGPATSARATSVLRGARASVRYRVDDLTPKARVRLVVRTPGGHRVATLKLGSRGTNAPRVATWRCTLRRGVYVVTVYATDQAGNRQATAGSAHLVVR
jgi:cytochrome c